MPTLVAADATCALLGGAAGYLVRFHGGTTSGEHAIHLPAVLLLPLLWVGVLALCRTYEPRFLGVGSEEYRRVMGAALGVSAAVAVLAYALSVDLARSFAVLALAGATALTLVVRYALRKRLHARRATSATWSSVVAVGHPSAVAALVRQVHSSMYHGMRVVAACTPDGEDCEELLDLGVDVRGTFDDIPTVVEHISADAVAVLTCPELDGPRLRRLGWELERTAADLYVAPAVMEVVGPRISIRPVCGLPLLHVERPEITGVRHLAKSAVDQLVAVVALVALSPLLLLTAAAIAVDSRGGVLFRQRRVGKDGRAFTMYKFRTMVSDAEARLADVAAGDQGNGVLYKQRHDPRCTRVGRLLRKHSIDELPQLLNVVRGDMSLVGPRPPLQREVDRYGEEMHRRFRVKPGLTGLWQINGRSDLSWEESVRLDLRYVENWSFAFDLMILWKTAAVVVKGDGGY